MIERIASLFGYYPYRCRDCKYRFLGFRYATSKGPPSSTEMEIKRTRSAIQWKKKRQEFLLYAIGLLVFLAFLYYITRPRLPGGE